MNRTELLKPRCERNVREIWPQQGLDFIQVSLSYQISRHIVSELFRIQSTGRELLERDEDT